MLFPALRLAPAIRSSLKCWRGMRTAMKVRVDLTKHFCLQLFSGTFSWSITTLKIGLNIMFHPSSVSSPGGMVVPQVLTGNETHNENESGADFTVVSVTSHQRCVFLINNHTCDQWSDQYHVSSYLRLAPALRSSHKYRREMRPTTRMRVELTLQLCL